MNANGCCTLENLFKRAPVDSFSAAIVRPTSGNGSPVAGTERNTRRSVAVSVFPSRVLAMMFAKSFWNMAADCSGVSTAEARASWGAMGNIVFTLFHKKTGQTSFYALFCFSQKNSFRGGKSPRDVAGRTLIMNQPTPNRSRFLTPALRQIKGVENATECNSETARRRAIVDS